MLAPYPNDKSLMDEIVSYRAELLRKARSYTGNADLAEDIVQNAYLKAVRFASERAVDRSNVHAWMHTILHHAFIDEIRKQPLLTVEELPDVIAPPGTDPFEHEFSSNVQQGLERLTDTQRTVLLCRASGLKYQEIAELHGIPIGTVMSSLHYACKAMKRTVA
jgi:RNA polymerase sigma-70 factor (ECF subfamily)